MKLAELTATQFVKELASASPAPGGGSVAAYAGALSAALCAMVARLTMGKPKYRAVWEEMAHMAEKADAEAGRLLELMDDDTDAYNTVLAAFRLPRETDDEKTRRRAAIEAATRQAAQVPLTILHSVAELMDITRAVVARGNANCITDAGTAVQLMQTAALSAAYNVRINIADLKDKAFADDCSEQVSRLVARVQIAAAAEGDRVNDALNANGT